MRYGLLKERARHGLVDFGQASDIDVCQPLLRPGIGLARIGMNGIGHELLAKAQHLQRMALDALERGICTIDQHALRSPANARGGRVAKPLARQFIDFERESRVLGNVDVDCRDRPAHDADAAARPARP